MLYSISYKHYVNIQMHRGRIIWCKIIIYLMNTSSLNLKIMIYRYTMYLFRVRVVVFNATFNNILVILWQSVLLVDETRENHWPVANFIPQCIEYTSPWAGFELTTLVVIGTVCICSSKSNYHMIMPMMVTQLFINI
jgi:hypothetical protein